MIFLLALLMQILHGALMIAAAPLAAGAVDRLAARFAGCAGPPWLLPWTNLVRLTRKTPVERETGSPAMRFAPAVAFGATASAAALVPSFTLDMALFPLADMLVIVSLLAIARVAGVLSALDSGAALPGLAAQRNAAAAVPAEAALLVAVFALALMGGSLNLNAIIGQRGDPGLLPPAAAVAVAALLALAVADSAPRDPALDQSLTDTGLAVLQFADWLRRLVWIDLIGALVVPFGLSAVPSPADWVTGFAGWAVRLGACIVGLAAAQTVLGTLPARRARELTMAAGLLALVAAVLVLTGTRMA
ncbi:MAG: NADH-quinone oxidoreductase subunit H [Rhodopila sp.]